MTSKHGKELPGEAPQPLLRHLQLRPHGERLLTSGAAFWLFAARAIVFAMASAEAVAWGYLGYLFGDDWVRWLVALTTGTVIFVVIWMIDVSLLTLDRASDEHARVIFGEEVAPKKKGYRTAVAVSTRVLVVIASLTITAPYLSQLVFHKDIDAWIKDRATTQIDQARNDLVDHHDDQIVAKDKEIEEKRNKLEAEVAGVGASKRYGIGPASVAIQEAISTLEAERVQLGKEKSAQLEDFETAVTDWSQNRDLLSARYDLDLPRSSILTNREALISLGSRPEHKSTELAIMAFLGFIFIGLLLLKLFEPRSIRFYLSEVLQQEYDRYLAGTFDSHLPKPERSSISHQAMTPQRLYDFLANVWAPKRGLEARESEISARKAVIREEVTALEEMLEQARPMVEQARREVEQDRDRCEQAEQSYQQLLSAIDLVQKHVIEFGAAHEELQEGDTELDALGTAVYGSHVRGQLGEAEERLRELQHAKELEETRLRRTQGAHAEAEKALGARREELRKIEEKVFEARSMMLSQHLRPSSVQTQQ